MCNLFMHAACNAAVVGAGLSRPNLSTCSHHLLHACAHAYSNIPNSPNPVLLGVSQVARNADGMTEFLKLEFLREIGFTHMRIGDGVNSRLQMSGMLAKLCKLALASSG
jgi:hypothetical protein